VVRILLRSGAKDYRFLSLLIAIMLNQHDIVQLFIDPGSHLHPTAEVIARYFTKDDLLKVILNDASNLLTALEEVINTKSDIPLKQPTRGELLAVQHLILETVTDIHFKTMSRYRGTASKQMSRAKNEDTLTLPVLLGEFMSLYLTADWQNIGALLDLPPVELSTIKHDNSRVIDCTREMLDMWLKTTDPPPSWEQLVQAVKVMDSAKADTIQMKYLC